MMTLAKLTATCFGIGYIEKGAGTVAALFYCAVWWAAGIGDWAWWCQLALIATLFSVGVWSGNRVEAVWGHDSNKVVIDEVLGMAVSLFMVERGWWIVATAFALFRLFDIIKPLGIRKMEAMQSGLGVMMDDLLAGVYALLFAQVILVFVFLIPIFNLKGLA